MFGHSRKKRQRKQMRTERANQESEKALNEIRGPDYNTNQLPEQQRAHSEQERNQAMQDAAFARQGRRTAQQEGRADTAAFLQQPMQGLDPAKRKAMQYEANKQIQRREQTAQRNLLGEQNQRGIVGKGGIAYNQQYNLQNVGREQRGQIERDLTRLNSDLELKNKAAAFAGGQGEAAMYQLDQQQALDNLQLNEEKRRQRRQEDQYNRQWHRM